LILGPKFLHIYLKIPNDILEKIVSNARQNGYRAIVVTCDDPTYRIREFVFPLFLEASKNIDPNIFQTIGNSNMNLLNIDSQSCLDKTPATWTNIQRLRKLTTLPIICKGILSPIDAEIAIKCGANGIVVRFVTIYPVKPISCYLVIMVVGKLTQLYQLLNV
jgi:isopentenyl diphosphate isomerase/L-lactate dehydrogenase-like FMN-dependent dehydrogenase